MLKKFLFLTYLFLAVFVMLFALGEDYTARGTCECYYKFENGGDLGEDNQNQIDLTNSGVTQSATIPVGTFVSPNITKSGDWELGDPDYMTASHAVAAEIDDLTAITIVCWVRPESLVASSFVATMAHEWGSGWRFRWFPEGGGGFHHVFDGVDAEDLPVTMNTGTWYFMVGTYDGTDAYLYQGTEEGQVAELDSTGGIGNTATTTGGFYVGSRWGPADYWDGLICELAVFSEALTLSDLEDIQRYGMSRSSSRSLRSCCGAS